MPAMPSGNAETLSKHLFGDLTVGNGNLTNITIIEDGPIIDRIRENQFHILLPSFVYTAILLSMGLPGNFLVAIVYLLKMAKTTSRHFIITLAICDFINCAFGMPVEMSLLFHYYDFDFPILCKVSRFTTFFMNNTSSLVLLAIAVDRYRRVCTPLKPNMTVAHSKIICIVVGVVACGCATPALYLYGTREIILPGPTNDTRLLLRTCIIDDEVDTRIPLVFSLYLYIFVVFQFLAMAVMYALVGRVVCRSRQGNSGGFKMSHQSTFRSVDSPEKTRRFSTRILRSFSHHSPHLIRKPPNNHLATPEVTEPFATRDRAHSDTSVRRHGGKDIRAGRTTLILFIVTIIFVLSFMPYLTIATMRYINPRLEKSMNTQGLTVYNLFLRSYLLNSAVNPIVYCFLNRQFRQKVKMFILNIVRCGRD